jgi:hypothetical protein
MNVWKLPSAGDLAPGASNSRDAVAWRPGSGAQVIASPSDEQSSLKQLRGTSR